MTRRVVIVAARLDTDGTVRHYTKEPTAGNLTGAGAVLGAVTTIYTPWLDHRLVVHVGGDRAAVKPPLNPLAELFVGRPDLRGPAYVAAESGAALTAGQVEQIDALARSLARYGPRKALAIARHWAEQEARRP